MSGKRFLIADASSLIFRGGSVKCSSDHNYKNGWSFMCRRVFYKIKELQPTHVCIAGDGTHANRARRTIFKEYKTNRPTCSELIKYQLQNASELCTALNMKYVSYDDYEGDDVINTLVHQAIQHNFDAIDILADDKDLFALLIDPSVAMHRLSKPAQDPIKVKNPSESVIPVNKFNVLAHQIPDYLALVGDASDNIKGCPTIGVKRAQWLLAKYENVDGILNKLKEIEQTKKSMAKHLRENQQLIRDSLRITTLHDLRDRISVTMDDMKYDVNSLEIEQLRNKFIEWNIENVAVEIEKVKKEISDSFRPISALLN